MNRNRIYSTVLIACIAGIAWTAYTIWQNTAITDTSVEVCLFKKATGFPCPSCGTTRSIQSLIEGNFLEALHWNPFGVVVFCIMLISPVWILIDMANRKSSFLLGYSRIENLFRSKWLAVPAIALVAANWVWNIIKGL
jgi:hypothetical protein